ncbi:MAG: zapA [Firmicutes bacterium]|nr:zapA [Bacillota bacterium]
MDKKNKVVVDIFGESYSLKGEGEPARMLEVADQVDIRMKQVSKGNPRLSTTKIAVLVALNLADEFLRLRDDYNELVALLEIAESEKHK